MSNDTPRQVIAQVVDEETFWRGIPRLTDAEFELFKEVWKSHRNALQARIGAGNVFDDVPQEWVYFRCDLHFQVIVTAREKESGTRAWREVVALWGRDALTSVFWAVASLHPFRALVPPKSLRQASDGFDTVERLLKTAQEKPEELLRGGWYAQGYAPQLSRWLVEVPCLLTDLVRVAERRRELERQQPAPAAAAPPADASPAPPAGPGQQQPAPAAPAVAQPVEGDAGAKRRLLAFLSKGEGVEAVDGLVEVLNSDATVEAKLQALHKAMPGRVASATLRELAGLIDCSPAAVAKTDVWQAIQARRNRDT